MKALQKFSSADQCLLRQIMTGSVTPASVLHAQNEENSCQCPHCGAAVEDLWHRWWECPAWAQARRAHPKAFARRHLISIMEARFGLMPHTEDLKAFRRTAANRRGSAPGKQGGPPASCERTHHPHRWVGAQQFDAAGHGNHGNGGGPRRAHSRPSAG